MKKILGMLLFICVVFVSHSMAMEGHSDMNKDDKTGAGTAIEGHDNMDHGSQNQDGSFKHNTMAGNVHTEFQIMDLASMNMKDPTGKTHHVMATFKRDGQKIMKLAGKVKLISPSGKEQLESLKDFGSGIFAANFTIDEPGKWGVICLFKDEEVKQTVKFWYPHMAM